jgi:hypothetical protein
MWKIGVAKILVSGPGGFRIPGGRGGLGIGTIILMR